MTHVPRCHNACRPTALVTSAQDQYECNLHVKFCEDLQQVLANFRRATGNDPEEGTYL